MRDFTTLQTEIMTGLKEQIEHANSEQEIAVLLSRGVDNYTQASDKTKRRWSRVATARTKYLALLKEANK